MMHAGHRAAAPAATLPRGWHRPVRPRALLVVSVALLLVWLALMAGGVMWFYARFESHITGRVQVKTVLPVSTDVPVDHEVLISTVARMHAPVFRWLPPLDVTVPVQLRLPVHLVVPVRAEVPLDLDVTVSGELRKSVNVPVDTVLALRPQVKGDIVARMQAQTAFRLFGPQEPVPMTIADARLRVPFDLTWFTRRAP